MGGYMGFGMQSWVYKRRPRKPFTKRGRIPSFSPLPKYSRTFTLKPKIKENSKALTLLFILSLITVFGLASVWMNNLKDYSHNLRVRVEESMHINDDEAFAFFIKSGKYSLKSNRPLEAYYEFDLAFKINPKDNELNQLLTETLVILSSKGEPYYSMLNSFLLREH